MVDFVGGGWSLVTLMALVETCSYESSELVSVSALLGNAVVADEAVAWTWCVVCGMRYARCGRAES